MTTHSELLRVPKAFHVVLVLLVTCLLVQVRRVACPSMPRACIVLLQGCTHLEYLFVLRILVSAQHGCWVSVSSVVNTCECKKNRLRFSCTTPAVGDMQL